MPAPIPPSEPERLLALSRCALLDTASEPEFERITAHAAKVFRVPTVLISLVAEHRQWFKSHHGLDRSETPRDQAFCAYTILDDRPLVVPDTLEDARFADNPLVTGEPHIRFYAGSPLTTREGANIGSLCLVDTVPRPFGEDEAATLADLAAMVVSLIEARLTGLRLQQEIQRHEQTTKAHRLVQTRYQQIAENIPGMVYQFARRADGHGEFLFVSDACREILEIEPAALLRDPNEYFKLVHPRDVPRRDRAVAESTASLQHLRWEGRHRLPSGRLRWLQISSQPERAANGDILWNGVLFDITDRRSAEEEARHAAGRVQTVLESITDAFYSLDRQWRFTYVNEQAQRVLERPRADLLGRSFWEVFPYKAKMAYHPEFHRSLETNQPAAFELFSAPLRKWLGVHAYPSEEGLSVYVQDITERKGAQQALEDSLELFRAIINGTDNTVFIKDRDGRYLLINPAGAALLGTTPEAIVGQDDGAFFSPEDAAQSRAFDQEIMESGTSRTYESSDTIAGSEHVFLSTKSPYRDAAGNLLGVIGIVREITAQRRAAEALREAKEEAERANNAKSEFLSRMSHELRTPLNAILGFGQLLEVSELRDGQEESVNHILKAGRHLLHLIDDVLAISRIEAGRMHLSLEPVPVGEMVRECLNLVGRQAADHDVRFTDRCGDEPVHVQADRQRLRQVLLNLLSNAVKYNRRGGAVTLTCLELPGTDGAGPEGSSSPALLRIEVGDTGQGLSAEEIGRLFTPFERLRAEHSSTEGTGLGLALSKGLVETMNGRIGVRSVPGTGSTFWVELPLASSPHHQAERGGLALPGLFEETTRGCVLYIEDNLSNLRLIEMLLDSSPGLELLSAQQGTLGFEIARARRPDLILLDLHLPDIPGWEVLEALQADPATRDIPVVIISADATSNRINRLLKAGARTYLTKPLNVRVLLDVLREYLNPGNASASVASNQPGPDQWA